MKTYNIKIKRLENPKKFYKYCSLSKNSLSNLVNNTAYFSSILDFNDPFESILSGFRIEAFTAVGRLMENNPFEDMRKELDKTMRLLGIYCLSTQKDNVLMWSHYADQHRGFCIEYSKKSEGEFWDLTKPVQYSSSFKSVIKEFQEFIPKNKGKTKEQINHSWNNLRDKLIYIKSKHWAYEDEWRTIHPATNPGLAALPPEVGITAIIFGNRTSRNDRNLIKKCTQDMSSILYKKCVGINQGFRMVIKDA